jgi:hypothetical protein
LYVNVNEDVPFVGVTVKGFPVVPLVNVPRLPPSESVTTWAPSKVAPVIVTVHVEDAIRKLPLLQPEKVSEAGLLVYAKLNGFVPLKLLLAEIVLLPVDAGVYVKVKEVAAAVGVTVRGAVPGDPTLGVTRPPCDPSATVTVMLPLKTPELRDTVQVLDATETYPDAGQPEKDRTSAETV